MQNQKLDDGNPVSYAERQYFEYMEEKYNKRPPDLKHVKKMQELTSELLSKCDADCIHLFGVTGSDFINGALSGPEVINGLQGKNIIVHDILRTNIKAVQDFLLSHPDLSFSSLATCQEDFSRGYVGLIERVADVAVRSDPTPTNRTIFIPKADKSELVQIRIDDQETNPQRNEEVPKIDYIIRSIRQLAQHNLQYIKPETDPLFPDSRHAGFSFMSQTAGLVSVREKLFELLESYLSTINNPKVGTIRQKKEQQIMDLISSFNTWLIQFSSMEWFMNHPDSEMTHFMDTGIEHYITDGDGRHKGKVNPYRSYPCIDTRYKSNLEKLGFTIKQLAKWTWRDQNTAELSDNGLIMPSSPHRHSVVATQITNPTGTEYTPQTIGEFNQSYKL